MERAKETTIFQDLMESLEEMQKHIRGEKTNVRISVLTREEPLTINSEKNQIY